MNEEWLEYNFIILYGSNSFRFTILDKGLYVIIYRPQDYPHKILNGTFWIPQSAKIETFKGA